MEERMCTKCHEIKPLDEFYKKTSGKPWGKCKACVSYERIHGKDSKKKPITYQDYVEKAGLVEYNRKMSRYCW